MVELNLPVIINGVPREDGERHVFEYVGGAKVTIPRLTKAMVDEIGSQDRFALHDLTVHDIIEFYGRVGDLWRNKDYPLRKRALEHIAQVTGYSREVVEFDLDNIPHLARRPYLSALIDVEMGDRAFLDEWRHKRSTLVHAEPRGRLLHVLVGNVPIAGLYSIVRAGITKNVNVLKLARRDPVTALYFCLSFQDVDPNHPITRSTSVVVWDGGNDPLEDEMIGLSDMVCVWGGEGAVRNIKKKIPPGVPLLEYGPRRSYQVIGECSVDEKRAIADRSAMDVCMYDQEACFSTQTIFVRGDAEEYADILAASMEKLSRRIPRGAPSVDQMSAVQLERARARFAGLSVRCPPNTDWTLVACPKNASMASHPLNRTVYVVPFDDFDEILGAIDPNVQTVAIYPYTLHPIIRDRLTLRGVDRIVEVGRTWKPRLGTPHDGTYTLPMMVRWVGVDRETSFNSVSYDFEDYEDVQVL